MAEVSEARRGRAGACYSGLTRSIGSDGEARISPSDGFQTSPLSRRPLIPARGASAPHSPFQACSQIRTSTPGCGFIAVSPPVNELFLCRGGGGTGEAGMADRGGTMAPFHCCPLCTDLCIVQPLFSAHTRPAGTEMAAPLTRFTMPPAVHATMEGHGHRHLCGPQEAEAGAGGGLAGRWCCQRLRGVEVAFSFRGGRGFLSEPIRGREEADLVKSAGNSGFTLCERRSPGSCDTPRSTTTTK